MREFGLVDLSNSDFHFFNSPKLVSQDKCNANSWPPPSLYLLLRESESMSSYSSSELLSRALVFCGTQRFLSPLVQGSLRLDFDRSVCRVEKEISDGPRIRVIKSLGPGINKQSSAGILSWKSSVSGDTGILSDIWLFPVTSSVAGGFSKAVSRSEMS